LTRVTGSPVVGARQRGPGGRPKIGDAAAVRRVLLEIEAAGLVLDFVSQLVPELVARIPCSRRTAYRAIERASEAKVIRITRRRRRSE
jgi:hypothetical protein